VYVTVEGDPAYVYTGARAFDRERPTIVFVHGAASDHSVWGLQARYFAHHGNNALAVDLPAHGRSGGSARPSIGAIADWLAALLDALGVDRALLVGHSMGAMIALREVEKNGGRGQVIDLPLLDPLFAVLGPQAAKYRLTGEVKARSGSRSTNTGPRNA